MIDDTIKAAARVGSNIEEECHEWFEDTSDWLTTTGATVSVPRITRRQEHRNNAPSVNPESHYRVNVAICFIDHLLEEMSSRFSEDNRAEAETFSLVPSAVIKHDSLPNLAEKLQFWQQDLPTPSSLLPELKETGILLETVHTHFTCTATGKSYRVCKICWWGYVPQHTSFAYYWLYPSC